CSVHGTARSIAGTPTRASRSSRTSSTTSWSGACGAGRSAGTWSSRWRRPATAPTTPPCRGRRGANASTWARSWSSTRCPNLPGRAATSPSIRWCCRPASRPPTTRCWPRARRSMPRRCGAARAKARIPARPVPCIPPQPRRHGHEHANDPVPRPRPPAALADGAAAGRDAVHRHRHGLHHVARVRAAAGDPQAAGCRDPRATCAAHPHPAPPPAAAAALRPSPLAAARGHLFALAAVRPDAGDAAQRLGDAVGGGLSGHAAGRDAAAVDRAARRRPVRLAARRPSLARAAAAGRVPAAPGGGALPCPRPPRRRAGQHGAAVSQERSAAAGRLKCHRIPAGSAGRPARPADRLISRRDEPILIGAYRPTDIHPSFLSNWYHSTEKRFPVHQPADTSRMKTMTLSTEDLQARLGGQLRRLRLARDLDQLTLADKAGVSEKALRNLEAGRGSSLSTLLQVLRARDRLDWLETLSPVASVSPMALLRQRPERERRRVRRPRGKVAATK